jgi:hypothetical protein
METGMSQKEVVIENSGHPLYVGQLTTFNRAFDVHLLTTHFWRRKRNEDE